MIKVHIKNFQSIKDTKVEIDGFTVVTGANNSGKSAIMRAIHGVFTNLSYRAPKNKGASSFVHHGATHCEVTLEFEDGQTVKWEKGKDINRYTVNGKLLDKVGTSVPPEVQAFAVYPIEAGGHKDWPQIAVQRKGQSFLIDLPGSALAEAVADVDRVGLLNRSLKLSEKEKREATNRLRVRVGDEKKLIRQLDEFQGLDDSIALVEDLTAKHKKAQRHLKAINGLKELRERLNVSRETVRKFSGIDSVEVPDDSTAKTIQAELYDALDLKSRYDQLRSEVDRLSPIEHTVLSEVNIPTAEKIKAALGVVVSLRDKRLVRIDQIQKHQKSIKDKQVELETAQNAVKEILSQMPSCPLCGSEETNHEHTAHLAGAF